MSKICLECGDDEWLTADMAKWLTGDGRRICANCHRPEPDNVPAWRNEDREKRIRETAERFMGHLIDVWAQFSSDVSLLATDEGFLKIKEHAMHMARLWHEEN